MTDRPETPPAARHRWVAGEFTTTVVGVAEWDATAPPEGWVARDVVRHLAGWLPGFLRVFASIELPSTTSVDDDPVATWVAHCNAVQSLLDDPAAATGMHDFGPLGPMTTADAVDRAYTTDVFLHRWDLARATGQDDQLDLDTCAALLAGMEPMDAALRASGHYGPRVPVADDADVQTRLLAFIGRDPYWVPGDGAQ